MIRTLFVGLLLLALYSIGMDRVLLALDTADLALRNAYSHALEESKARHAQQTHPR